MNVEKNTQYKYYY